MLLGYTYGSQRTTLWSQFSFSTFTWDKIWINELVSAKPFLSVLDNRFLSVCDLTGLSFTFLMVPLSEKCGKDALSSIPQGQNKQRKRHSKHQEKVPREMQFLKSKCCSGFSFFFFSQNYATLWATTLKWEAKLWLIRVRHRFPLL